jgi:putative MATE family efflux protein
MDQPPEPLPSAAPIAVLAEPEPPGSPPRDRSRQLVEGPILATLVGLAAPTIGLMIVQALVTAGEAAYVGWLGTTALAGVSLSFPVILIMTTMSAGAFGGGTASAVARSLGAGRHDVAARIAGTALSIAVVMGLVTTAVMLVCGRWIYVALGAEPHVIDEALVYSNVIFLGAIPFWMFNMAAAILRGGGNAALPAMVGVGGGIFTLAVSPLFIFGLGPIPGLGVIGAGLAVVAYSSVGAVILIAAIASASSPARPTLAHLRPDPEAASEILRVAIPSAAATLIANTTFLLLTGLVAPFGEEATAAYGAGGRLEFMLIPIIFGLGSALIPIVAANLGAGRFDRVQQATRIGTLITAGLCALIGLVAFLLPVAWMSVFSDDPKILAIGSDYLTRLGPVYPFFGIGLVLYFVAQGRGQVVMPMAAGFIRLLVAGVGGLVAVSYFGWTLNGLFDLMAVGLILYGLTMILIMRRELGLVNLRT